MTEEKREGRLIRGVGGLYTARDDAGDEYVLRARGKFRREGMVPMVGDLVSFTPGDGEEHGWLLVIHGRRTQLIRPPVANVSLLIIVVAPKPAPDLLLVDRLLVHARRTGLDALLCLNKQEMDDALWPQLAAQYKGAGVPVLGVSAQKGEGFAPLRQAMAGEICVLAGQSAVGKSTLLNALCGLQLKTGEMSRINRGKHTTRHAELLTAGGLTVLDTPGFSLLSLAEGMAPEALRDYYPEMEAMEGCRFSPCLHDREPDCAVRRAVAEGRIHPARHERYRQLLGEVRETWKGRYG